MTRIMTVAVLLGLAACGQREAAEPAINESGNIAAAPEAKADAPGLDGSWQVTMIDGAEAKQLGMTATMGSGQASLSNGCFRRAWTYSQKGNMVDFTSSPSGSSNCGGQTPGNQEETAYAALDDVNIAIFSLQGKRADLSGTGGTLTLERR